MSWVVVRLTPWPIFGCRFGTEARILRDSWVRKLNASLGRPAPSETGKASYLTSEKRLTAASVPYAAEESPP